MRTKPAQPVSRLAMLGNLFLFLPSAACSTSGTAVGDVKEPWGKLEPVKLVWKSDPTDLQTGVISGALPDGTEYSGRCFEVIDTASGADYAVLWEGWPEHWGEWPEDGPVVEISDWPTFVKIYTGRVIASLESSDGTKRLRCRFHLDKPREGLVGGGTGECQASNGETVGHVVLTSS